MTRWITNSLKLYAIAALVITLVAPLGRAVAAEVDAETGDGFDRLRFTWPARVGYTAQRFDDALLIRFARRVQGDVVSVASDLGEFIASAELEDGGRDVIVRLTGRHRFRTYRDGSNVVIDVGEASAVSGSAPRTTTAPASAQESGAPQEKNTTGPTLVVRTGEHPDYQRLVFDWPSKTSYTVAEGDGAARIAFGRPARLDAKSLRSRLPGQFSGLRAEQSAAGNLDVVIPIPDGIRVRHFLSGSKVVVDLIKDANARSPAAKAPKLAKSQETPKPAAPAPPPKPAVEEVSQTGKTELASKFGLAPSQNPDKASPAETLTPGKADSTPAAVPAEAAPSTPVTATILPASIVPCEKPAPEASGVGAISAANAAEVPPAASPANALDAGAQAPRASEQGAACAKPEGDNESLVASLRASENATISGPPLMVGLSRSNDAVSLRFDWTEPVAAAVFTRAEHLWVVFDAPVTFDLAQLTATPGQIMGPPQQIAVSPGSALRIPLVAGISPRVWRDGTAWIVDLRPQAMRPDVALDVETQQSSPLGPRVFVLAEGVGRTTIARDPEVGDL
ncbi:MAG: hypothetical protein P8N43_09680, partial [Alphaproteobacteria bacterium]|nr:hypothetical protein [Alphaproteobacteria bacterium]